MTNTTEYTETLPPLLTPGELFCYEELQALFLQGHVRPGIGDTFFRGDAPDTAGLRAESVLSYGSRYFHGEWQADLLTAVWVYLGGPPPPVFELATRYHQRRKILGAPVPLVFRQLSRGAESEDGANAQDPELGQLKISDPETTVENLLRLGTHMGHLRAAARMVKVCRYDELIQRFESLSLLKGVEQAKRRFAMILKLPTQPDQDLRPLAF